MEGAPVTERGRRLDPRALDDAAEGTGGDANAWIIVNAFGLPRIGLGVDIQRAVVRDEPDWRLHAFAVPLEHCKRKYTFDRNKRMRRQARSSS